MQVKHYQAVECSIVVYCWRVGAVNLNAPILVPRERHYKFHPSIRYNKKSERRRKRKKRKRKANVDTREGMADAEAEKRNVEGNEEDDKEENEGGDGEPHKGGERERQRATRVRIVEDKIKQE